MTPRTAWSIILLLLVFPAHEVWQSWRSSNRDVNWWIALDYPLSIQWYFKFLGMQLSQVSMSIVIYRISYKIQALRMAATVVLIYSLVDLAMFFICFNRAPYALIYSTVGAVSMVVIHWRYIRKGIKNLFQKIIQHNARPDTI